jgi:hypothetical protein
MWQHKAVGQTSDWKTVHNGDESMTTSPIYPMNLAVSVVTNAAGNFSHLKLTNATRQFAGRYKCIEGNITWSASNNEAEVVVLGESAFLGFVSQVFTLERIFATYNVVCEISSVSRHLNFL